MSLILKLQKLPKPMHARLNDDECTCEFVLGILFNDPLQFIVSRLHL